MNFKHFLNLVTVLLLFCAASVFAQQGAAVKGSVTGKLIDAGTNQPLEFATVTLLKKADNLPAKSIQTDLQGNFKLDNLPDGLYLLRTTYVGYATYTKDSINISPRKRVYVLNTIKLGQTKGVLKEVAIKAQRSQIQLGVDRKVFSVDQSLVSQGGSATDLLNNVPSVQVDVDGNLNLRGTSNVRVLINGKPSALTGSSMADILQSIPASAIENIEVITNPSSKYDAEGQSGIINIVLKKNARLGMNGSVSGSVGNQKSVNGSANIAYQTQKINLYANYSYRKAQRTGNGFTNRTTTGPGIGTTFQNQIADQSFDFNSNNIRAGIDINLDPKTTLSFSGNANLRNRNRFQFGDTRIIDGPTGALKQLTSQDASSFTHGNRNLDYNADFDRKYKKGELTANVGYSTGHEDADDYQTIAYNVYQPTPSNRLRKQINVNGEQGYNVNLQTDYTQPLSNNNKIELGYRSTFAQNDSHNDVDSLLGTSYVPDGRLTNHFLYKEQVHAVYGNYQQQFGQFGVQVGLRAESAHIRTLLREGNVANGQDYFRVYPSIFLSDKLSENQTLQISYTRRVSRPRDRQISPFLDTSDPYNYQQGTPTLKPEDTHSFELSYINYWKSVTLTSSLYTRITNDNIQRVRTPYNNSTTVVVLHSENITSSQNSGFELIGKVNATQNLDITANVNAYYSYLQAAPQFGLNSTSGFAWNGNLTANIKPAKKLGVQLRGDYNAPQVISQGKQRAMYGLDGGLKYDITKALNLSANVRDIFNSRKFGSNIDYMAGTASIHSESVRRFQTRTMQVTLSYRFGSAPDDGNKKKGKKDKKDGNNGDDMGGNPDEGGNGGGKL
ncbi:TonB-dependent receptor [Mucilaginibacter mali]|uniref:TonB-dependent receptor n=1 Tax=Mucilaginibacter mali TaxID=2740462 RepID=A0A7D4QBY8_9SPHI|nr:outer membrane beta-barrel family protein [Mucilaginibacter mali]QKJ31965.1 TonB-dependent receptor [Mucilaginibacter mali]